MRMLNKPQKAPEDPVPVQELPPSPKVKPEPKPKPKPLIKSHWYRVAIMRYSDTKKLYTCVIDKPEHTGMIQTNPNFICWENPVVTLVGHVKCA